VNKVLAKRTKFIISSIIIGVAVFLSAKFFSNPFHPLSPVILAVISAGSTVWALDFELKGIDYIIFPIYPILLAAVAQYSSVILVARGGESKLFSLDVKLSIIGVFVVTLFYGLFSSLNILNVATIKTVPLKKAAFSVMVVYGVLISLLGYALLYEGLLISIDFNRQILLGAFLAFCLCLPLSTLVQENEYRVPWLMAALTGLFIGEIGIILGFGPINYLFRSIFTSGVLFLLINLIIKRINRDSTRWALREYLVIFTILLIFLFSGIGK